MKLAAFLLICASLILGVIASVTAYLPPLSLGHARLEGLTLNAPAGAVLDDAGKPSSTPLLRSGAKLTAENLSTLGNAGVKRVRVKEFSFARWPEWWLFLIACAGLGAGAFIIKRENRLAVERAAAGAGVNTGPGPDQAFANLCAQVDQLRTDLKSASTPDDRLRLILERLSEAQNTSIAAFIAARPILISRLGVGGYARLMDTFAAAERQINRAWSAAADEVEHESLTCIEQAASLLEATKGRLSA
ncbi:MAG: hypothetical protein KF864_08680 [Phycisphaeraceae bacterium]|nr:hypothetical protein [Phycisphaeraceae bacterium]